VVVVVKVVLVRVALAADKNVVFQVALAAELVARVEDNSALYLPL
jgi:hypothetical protein